ncbi:MAG: hypothetical protein ABIY50_04120 [Ignavibacteria bacterium]
MKENIIANIDNPKELEKLYRLSRSSFKTGFNSAFPELKNNKLADFWSERLNYESTDVSLGTKKELTFMVLASLLAAAIVKIPAYLPVGEEYFYPRNAGFVFFPILIMYFSWKNKIPLKKFAVAAAAVLFSLVFINMLPEKNSSDTLKLSCIHLPLLLWSVLGFIFAGGKLSSYGERLGYLRYNGDLIVITAIILIAGGILTALTQGLFSLIEYNIFEFYLQYIVMPGVAAAPIIGTYVIEKNPQLVNKVSPVIAKIFCPVVLVTLIAYLIAIIISGKDPYNDRDFLIAFNGLLVIVMAIIVFSIAETSKSDKNRIEILILFLLSAVTIIVNGIALSAILFRISEWGITPNRAAVLGGNILILINLLLVTYKLLRTLLNKSEPEEIGKTISSFLPIYTLWTMIVTFLFPFVFGFR